VLLKKKMLYIENQYLGDEAYIMSGGFDIHNIMHNLHLRAINYCGNRGAADGRGYQRTNLAVAPLVGVGTTANKT
jgi:hypothetical protein